VTGELPERLTPFTLTLIFFILSFVGLVALVIFANIYKRKAEKGEWPPKITKEATSKKYAEPQLGLE
jgi:hypothetical protein